MDNNKKNSSTRNEFTAALSEELLSRKIFEKAKPKQKSEEEELFLDEFEGDLIAEPIVVPEPKKVSPAKTSTVKTSTPKISTPKISTAKTSTSKTSTPKTSTAKIPEEKIFPQNLNDNLTAESELEERIFSEADNDFYDEKDTSILEENIRSGFMRKKDPRTTVFHSQYFKDQQEIEVEEKPKDQPPPEPDPNLYRKLTRAELTGLALSAIMMIYAFATLDKPLFFMAFALFTHLLRPLIGGLCGRYNRAVQNGMRSFSIALFFGAILFIFT